MKVNEVKDDVVSDTDSDSDYMLRVIRNKVQIVQRKLRKLHQL